MRNKSRQEIDLTREGEALVEHAALNALLFQHGRDAPGVGEPGAVYVTLAGVDPGWEEESCTSPSPRASTRWARRSG